MAVVQGERSVKTSFRRGVGSCGGAGICSARRHHNCHAVLLAFGFALSLVGLAFGNPSVKLSWSPNELVTDVPSLPSPAILYVFLADFPSNGRLGLLLERTTYRDEAPGQCFGASGNVGIPNVAWTDATPQVHWGPLEAHLRIQPSDLDGRNRIAVQVIAPRSRRLTFGASYAMIQGANGVIYADVSGAIATVNGGSSLLPPVHGLQLAPSTVRAGDSNELNLRGSHLNRVEQIRIVGPGGRTVQANMTFQSPEELRCSAVFPVQAPGTWGMEVVYGRRSSGVPTPILVIPSDSSLWLVGTQVWRASPGGIAESRFSAVDPCPARYFSAGSRAYVLNNYGQIQAAVPAIGDSVSPPSLFNAPDGLLVAQGGEVGLWSESGRMLWQRAVAKGRLSYSEEQHFLLSCGGGHATPASKITTIIDTQTGSDWQIPAGPVVNGIPLTEGFVVVRVSEDTMGRDPSGDNTLMAYSRSGALKWSRSVGQGICQSLSLEGGHILVLLFGDRFHATVVDEHSGEVFLSQDFPNAGSCTATLSPDGRKGVFALETNTESGPCVQLSVVDVTTSAEQWTTQIGCVRDWEARGGRGFVVVPPIAVSEATGDIALATYYTMDSGESSGVVFIVDSIGSVILEEEAEAHGGVNALEFLANSRYLLVGHPEQPRMYAAR